MHLWKDEVKTEEITQMLDAIYKVQGSFDDEIMEPIVLEALPKLSSSLSILPPSTTLKIYRSVAANSIGVLTS
jgi:hypothetical protein